MKSKDSQIQSEVKKLQYELSFAHELNNKMAQELREYQTKYGLQVKKYKVDTNKGPEFINSNGYLQQLFYLEPLLLAYEDKMAKMEYLLQDLQEDSKIFQLKINQIVSENDFLRTELENKCKLLLEKEAVGGVNIKYLKLENENYKEKQQIIKLENEEYKTLLEKTRAELENLKKQKKNELIIEELNKKIEFTKEQNRQLEIANVQLKKDLDVLRNKAKNDKLMLAELQNKNGMLETEFSRVQNELRVVANQYEHLQANHQDTVDHLRDEVDNLKTQLKITQKHETDLFNKNLTLETELQNKNNIYHNAQLKMVSTENNNHSLMQMLESYENKVSHQNKRIKKLQDELKYMAEAVKDKQKEKDLLIWKLEQKQKQHQRRDIQFKSEKQRLAKNYQDRLQSIRRSSESQKSKIQQEISALKASNISLEIKVDKLTKQNIQLKNQNIKLYS